MSQGSERFGTRVPANPAEWLSFPTLGRIFDSELASSIELFEQKVELFQSQAELGPAVERVRARLVCPAYRHALALLYDMDRVKNELRDQQAQDQRVR